MFSSSADHDPADLTLLYLVCLIYLLTAVGLTPSGSSTVHIYIQTIHRTTQLTETIHGTTLYNT